MNALTRWSALCEAGAESKEVQAAWDALPLHTRVRLCAACGWLDAVWEVCSPLGRWLDRRRCAR